MLVTKQFTDESRCAQLIGSHNHDDSLIYVPSKFMKGDVESVSLNSDIVGYASDFSLESLQAAGVDPGSIAPNLSTDRTRPNMDKEVDLSSFAESLSSLQVDDDLPE
ncbi:hypothetical protein [Capybara microvirus Cap1_SP_84]|nr:hypothetical protein [Capybara microvirus Cap1_SP_84]